MSSSVSRSRSQLTEADLEEIRELLQSICKALVDLPDQIKIDLTLKPACAIFYVVVGDNNVGQLLGKGGHMAKAIRKMVRAAVINKLKQLHHDKNLDVVVTFQEG